MATATRLGGGRQLNDNSPTAELDNDDRTERKPSQQKKRQLSISFSAEPAEPSRRRQQQQQQQQQKKNSKVRSVGCLTRRQSSVMEGSSAIKEVEDFRAVYDVFSHLGSGRFGSVKLAHHRASQKTIALKLFPRLGVRQVDFVREYNYSYFLSAHPNIVVTYEGMYSSALDGLRHFFFAQEFCPSGSLRDAVMASGGLEEEKLKKVIGQLLEAVEFMHDEGLVHRNLKAENVLIFDLPALERVKLTDFGLTRRVEAEVKQQDLTDCYQAPELCDTLRKETVIVSRSVDVWSVGVIVYFALRGRFPWQQASILCRPYFDWEQWMKRRSPHLPAKWARFFCDKGIRLFKKTLNPRPKDRVAVKELKRLLKDRWTLKSKSVSDEDLAILAGGRTASAGHQSLLLSPSTAGPRSSRSMAEISGAVQRSSPRHQHYAEAGVSPSHRRPHKRKSMLQQWVSATFSAMADISEQVVSATE